VQAIATAESHCKHSGKRELQVQNASGDLRDHGYSTVTAAGSGKAWQLNAISLTLVVN